MTDAGSIGLRSGALVINRSVTMRAGGCQLEFAGSDPKTAHNAQEQPAGTRRGQAGKEKDTKAAPDKRQAPLLLPSSGGRKGKQDPVAESAAAPPRRRRKM